MLSVRSRCPVDYRLCNQTVTVYHRSGETYSRKIINNAFFDFKKNESIDKTGSSEVNSFLLIVPCSEQAVFVGDKVLLGEGKPIDTPEAWAAFIPSKVAGLCVLKNVDPKYWGGRMVHVEAGG